MFGYYFGESEVINWDKYLQLICTCLWIHGKWSLSRWSLKISKSFNNLRIIARHALHNLHDAISTVSELSRFLISWGPRQSLLSSRNIGHHPSSENFGVQLRLSPRPSRNLSFKKALIVNTLQCRHVKTFCERTFATLTLFCALTEQILRLAPRTFLNSSSGATVRSARQC